MLREEEDSQGTGIRETVPASRCSPDVHHHFSEQTLKATLRSHGRLSLVCIRRVLGSFPSRTALTMAPFHSLTLSALASLKCHFPQGLLLSSLAAVVSASLPALRSSPRFKSLVPHCLKPCGIIRSLIRCQAGWLLMRE